MKNCCSLLRFTVANSIFRKTNTKSDMNQLEYTCFICKIKCKEPVSRVGVNVAIVLYALCIVVECHLPRQWIFRILTRTLDTGSLHFILHMKQIYTS